MIIGFERAKPMLPLWRSLAFLSLPGLLFTGCATLRSLELQSSQFIISPQQETQIGLQFSQEIEKDVKILNDPAAQAWVQKVGDKLAAQSPACEQKFKFQVTTAEEVNAFAIPGGYCYVNLGLIRAADNEAEVAAVVGHEINHVTQRHGVRSMQRAVGIDLLASLIQTDNAQMTQVVGAVKNAGGVVAMRSFGREDERESDKLGVEAMYKAGYDPRAAVTFFQKLHQIEQQQGGGSGGMLQRIVSTHPTTSERITNIQTEIQAFPLSKNLVLDTPEFDQLKARVAKIPVATPAATPAPSGPSTPPASTPPSSKLKK